MREQTEFFAELYRSRQEELEPPPNYLENIHIPLLDDTEKGMLDDPIVLEEVTVAIKMLNKFKSPGYDGLPAEIFQRYIKKIALMLLELYKEVLNKGRLHLSARRGIISLIQKTGGTRDFKLTGDHLVF